MEEIERILNEEYSNLINLRGELSVENGEIK
jgi:hypothetical protein